MSQQNEHLARKMEARHIRMISLGGVIGTGLFLSSGYTIHEAGPLGTILAYLVGAILVYAVMLCLGEANYLLPCLIPVPSTSTLNNLLGRPPALPLPSYIG